MVDTGAMKLRVHDPAFVAEQRRIANGWIQETAPQGAVGNGKRPGALWLLLKKEMEHQRERHRTAFRNMPCMPFDVWLLMKDEEDIATAGGSKVEPPEVKEERKHYYRRWALLHGFATSAASVQKQHQDLMLGRSGTVLGTTSVEHTRPGFRLSEPEKLDT
ncbi:unnamed protein product [Cladocopium goreaui]|uniref:Uncharacterized protein n=1 Tax=Cladocopium goreaui TaxID=2562237 RepID=A0A9P1BP37_9DINO|nr:unnamed protein product [Cladocopium goreaui]